MMSEWISVDKQEPPLKKEVLFWSSYLETILIGTSSEWQSQFEITHWQPLPEPPTN